VQQPIRIVDGHVGVPRSAGMGFEIDQAVVDAVTTSVDRVYRYGQAT